MCYAGLVSGWEWRSVRADGHFLQIRLLSSVTRKSRKEKNGIVTTEARVVASQHVAKFLNIVELLVAVALDSGSEACYSYTSSKSRVDPFQRNCTVVHYGVVPTPSALALSATLSWIFRALAFKILKILCSDSLNYTWFHKVLCIH